MSAAVQNAVLSTTGGTSTATIPVTFGSAVTAGNTIVFAFSWDTTTGVVINSVTDGLGNTYTQVDLANDTANGQAFAVYIATSIAGGTCSPTANMGASHTFRAAVAVEYSGVGGWTVDQHAKTVDGAYTTTATGPSITPTANGETVIACGEFHNGGAPTAGGSFTQDGVTGSGAESVSVERLDQGTAAAITATWNIAGVTGNFNAVILSLKQASVAAPPPPRAVNWPQAMWRSAYR